MVSRLSLAYQHFTRLSFISHYWYTSHAHKLLAPHFSFQSHNHLLSTITSLILPILQMAHLLNLVSLCPLVSLLAHLVVSFLPNITFRIALAYASPFFST